jgi:hypothetical protein
MYFPTRFPPMQICHMSKVIHSLFWNFYRVIFYSNIAFVKIIINSHLSNFVIIRVFPDWIFNPVSYTRNYRRFVFFFSIMRKSVITYYYSLTYQYLHKTILLSNFIGQLYHFFHEYSIITYWIKSSNIPPY